MTDTLEEIARRVLKVGNLTPRGNDDLDFHSVAVWRLREALEAAYRAGRAEAGAGAAPPPGGDP